jgi:hypothetical protein
MRSLTSQSLCGGGGHRDSDDHTCRSGDDRAGCVHLQTLTGSDAAGSSDDRDDALHDDADLLTDRRVPRCDAENGTACGRRGDLIVAAFRRVRRADLLRGGIRWDEVRGLVAGDCDELLTRDGA